MTVRLGKVGKIISIFVFGRNTVYKKDVQEVSSTSNHSEFVQSGCVHCHYVN